MHTSIALISVLAATVAANTAYTTVDVTITSCGPEVSSCPGKHQTTPVQPQTVYSTVDVTVTSCGPEVSSCPGKPTTYSPGTASQPASVSSVPGGSVPTGPMTPAIPSRSSSAPPAPPAGYSSVPAPPPAKQSSAPPSQASSVGPLRTSVVTVVSSSKGPIGTGTGVVSPKNATSTYPPIASYTGAASHICGSYGAVAGLAAMAAFFMA